MNDTTSPSDDVYSMDELEKDLTRARGGRRAPWLLAGIVIGIAGTLFLPPLVQPYLPESLRGSQELATGPVLAEQREGARLLLTVQAEQGAMLATFTERVAEIDLLVAVGDTVTLGVARYQPFVENPKFEGVRKAAGSEAAGAAEGESGAEQPGLGQSTEGPGRVDPDAATAPDSSEADSGAEEASGPGSPIPS